jgi:hypothetical protein
MNRRSNRQGKNCQPRFTIALLLTLLLTLLVGCVDRSDPHRYGVVDGWRQFAGRNGLGAHRRVWEQAGARCVAPKRLSNRLEQVQVVVLVAQSFDPPSRQAREWLEQWLKASPGRSVIYFGRDFNANIFYYEQVMPQLSGPERALAELRVAQLRLSELQELLESTSESTFCDWFYLDPSRPAERLNFSTSNVLPVAEIGEMTEVVTEGSVPNFDQGLAATAWPIRTRLLPPDARFKEQPPSWITQPATSTANPMKPLTGPLTSEEDKLIVRSPWRPEEMDSIETWNAAFDRLLDSEVLVESAEGEPLIYRLTDPDRLGEGQILVVANGAPFLNASIVDPSFFQLSELVVQQCLPASRVALLAYDFEGLQISYVDESDERGAGLEMFLQWPLSAIMMSAALLGLIACASLLPILGRSQELPTESVSDFGLHVEAMGQMLHQTQDETYARQVISKYFRTVRGEPPPPWLDLDSK